MIFNEVVQCIIYSLTKQLNWLQLSWLLMNIFRFRPRVPESWFGKSIYEIRTIERNLARKLCSFLCICGLQESTGCSGIKAWQQHLLRIITDVQYSSGCLHWSRWSADSRPEDPSESRSTKKQRSEEQICAWQKR